MKLPAFFCKGIEIGRTNLGTTKGLDVAISHVINEDKNHIRFGDLCTICSAKISNHYQK